MTVDDVMLFMQSRLSDLKSEKWNDIELLDCINLAYMDLATNLRLFMQEKEYQIEEQNKEIIKPLPSNFIDVVKLKYNKTTIPLIRYDSIIENEGNSYPYASILNSNIIIYGKVGIYSLFYYCYFILVDKKDTLLTPDICFNALSFYAIYLALQKKPHMQAHNEMAMYKQLYQEELKKCKFYVFKAKETQGINTIYVRV